LSTFFASFFPLRCFAADAFWIEFRRRTGTRFDWGSAEAFSKHLRYTAHVNLLPTFIVAEVAGCVVTALAAPRNFKSNFWRTTRMCQGGERQNLRSFPLTDANTCTRAFAANRDLLHRCVMLIHELWFQVLNKITCMSLRRKIHLCCLISKGQKPDF
jgi:hypothetical protein